MELGRVFGSSMFGSVWVGLGCESWKGCHGKDNLARSAQFVNGARGLNEGKRNNGDFV